MGSEGHVWDLRDNRMHVRHTFLPHWSGGIGRGGGGEVEYSPLTGGGLRGASCSIKVLSGEVKGLGGDGGRRPRACTILCSHRSAEPFVA